MDSIRFDGIGFMNTNDGLYVFLPLVLRGGGFSCKPKENHSGRRNESDDEPDGSFGKGWPEKVVIPSVPQQSAY